MIFSKRKWHEKIRIYAVDRKYGSLQSVSIYSLCGFPCSLFSVPVVLRLLLSLLFLNNRILYFIQSPLITLP